MFALYKNKYLKLLLTKMFYLHVSYAYYEFIKGKVSFRYFKRQSLRLQFFYALNEI